ncbi:hypothetical protein NDU88_004464 [Pleurodeles waltl]|uniref:Uncharacterized protein n=1 Tax=Pleurodeles waltl TaxID=8319 RepID=A0AAV7TU83_PLEWA|nr:hypothetical protein NDU88_004464 [Pleurodeles waltl]
MPTLRERAGSLVYSQAAINGVFQKHQFTIYIASRREVCDPDLTFLDEIDLPQLSVKGREDMEKPIIREEILAAIKKNLNMARSPETADPRGIFISPDRPVFTLKLTALWEPESLVKYFYEAREELFLKLPLLPSFAEARL